MSRIRYRLRILSRNKIRIWSLKGQNIQWKLAPHSNDQRMRVDDRTLNGMQRRKTKFTNSDKGQDVVDIYDCARDEGIRPIDEECVTECQNREPLVRIFRGRGIITVMYCLWQSYVYIKTARSRQRIAIICDTFSLARYFRQSIQQVMENSASMHSLNIPPLLPPRKDAILSVTLV